MSSARTSHPVWAHLGRLLALVLICALSLQLWFLLRIAAMAVIDPASTSFQRSEAVRLLGEADEFRWSQEWVPADQLSKHLRRAVIASEDAGFVDHPGVEWDAIEAALSRNEKAEARAERLQAQQAKRAAQAAAKGGTAPAKKIEAKVVGGSTITQQLAKNLFLSGERTLARKGQEMLLAFMLEGLLDKQRILTLYLNHVEFGAGIFGAEAASQHYYRSSAAKVSAEQAARLAVMLPAPKLRQRQPYSAYMNGRTATIVARMSSVELP
ncbi:transglycosylase domain-containing protein [Ideonella paludis]|uniref:Biosynthetic peptidoglycan transglycosylase n=1 Tax=Ideonella paludis TaxID=1233411 RepID=A0ABS5DWR6_9BURK|nr:transglycosylase domain-containing protein [Ideonella paludis]MBQ0935519.1 transglycosylase domain-containing protein [Ideonella paludis]